MKIAAIWTVFGVLFTLMISGPSLGQDLDPQQAMALTAKAFQAAAEKIAPSLVTIESFGGVSTRAGRIGGIRKQGLGNTTGVIISADGYVVTSTFNFATEPPVITLITQDGTRHYAEMIGRDDTRKICLLKIDGAGNLPVPESTDLAALPVGAWAISVGVGYGDSNPAISMGIISAKDRVGGRAIQTDANISPANYGGPLVDIKGRLIGICVPLNPQSQAIGAGVEWYDSGIGFAIPVAADDSLIERLKVLGTHIYPAYLGVKLIANPEGKGLWVEQVMKGSPAEAAGIEREDVLLGIDDHEVTNVLQLRKVLGRFESGESVTLKIYSESAKQEQQREVRFIPPPKSETENQLEPPEIR